MFRQLCYRSCWQTCEYFIYGYIRIYFSCYSNSDYKIVFISNEFQTDTNFCLIVAEHQRGDQNQHRNDRLARFGGSADHWLRNGGGDRRCRSSRSRLRHSRRRRSTTETSAENRCGRGCVGACRAQASECRAAPVTRVRANVGRHCFTTARELGVEHRVFGNDETQCGYSCHQVLSIYRYAALHHR
jgi:hypothetical protein